RCKAGHAGHRESADRHESKREHQTCAAASPIHVRAQYHGAQGPDQKADSKSRKREHERGELAALGEECPSDGCGIVAEDREIVHLEEISRRDTDDGLDLFAAIGRRAQWFGQRHLIGSYTGGMKVRQNGIGAVIAVGFLLSPARSAAEDWPQWRGPSSQGISAEAGLPARWSAKENIVWKAKLVGFGASSPIVSGGTVIVTSQIGSYASGGGQYPKLARDDRSLSMQEHAIGGSRMASGEGTVFLA